MTDYQDLPVAYVLRQSNVTMEELGKSLGVSRQTAAVYVRNYDLKGPASLTNDVAAALTFLKASTSENAHERLESLERHRIHFQEQSRPSFSPGRKGRPPKPIADKLITKSNSIYRSLNGLSFEQSTTVLRSVIMSMYSDMTKKYFGKYLEKQKNTDVDRFDRLYEDNINVFFFHSILHKLIDVPPYEACGYPESRVIKGYIESALNHYNSELETAIRIDPDFPQCDILSDLGIESFDFSRQWFVAMYFYSALGKHEALEMLPEVYAAKDIEDARRIAVYVDNRDNPESNADYICILGPFTELAIANDAKAFVWIDWDSRFKLMASPEEMRGWLDGLKSNDYLEFNGLVDESYKQYLGSFNPKDNKDCYLTWYVL